MKFVRLCKYSISSRGVFLLVRNESSRVVNVNEIKEKITIYHNGEETEYDVLGIDFPNKISKVYLKKGDVIGIQIETT